MSLIINVNLVSRNPIHALNLILDNEILLESAIDVRKALGAIVKLLLGNATITVRCLSKCDLSTAAIAFSIGAKRGSEIDVGG